MQQHKIQTLLVDDEEHALDTLETLLQGYDDIKIMAKISDPLKALKEFPQIQPDLVFLDIHMPEMDGFELLEVIQQMKLQPTIIFTTSYDQYAIKAIRHAAFDFLVKPVDRQELDNAIQRFRKNRDKKTGDQIKSLLEQWHSNKKFKFNTHNGIIFIDPDEIVYLEAQCNYTSIIINNNNEELISTNIGTLEKQLPSPPFFRVSRSAIINTRYLNKINRKEKTCILAKNNMSFNISITKKKIKELEEEL